MSDKLHFARTYSEVETADFEARRSEIEDVLQEMDRERRKLQACPYCGRKGDKE